MGVAALVAVLGIGLVAAGIAYLGRGDQPIAAVASSPGASQLNGPSGDEPSNAGSTAPPSGGPLVPVASPTSGVLPVIGFGQLLGTQVRMAPGTDGRLFVSIPTDEGTTLSQLDESGKPRPGWPLVIPGARCMILLPMIDGSIRAVCGVADPVLGGVTRAFAFDRNAGTMPGWPVDIGGGGPAAGRMIGGELTLYMRQNIGNVLIPGTQAGDGWIVSIGSDGTVRTGERSPFVLDLGEDTIAIGPDGVAYWTDRNYVDPSPRSVLNALGPAGVPSGFPIVIDGIASGPAFDAAGRIHLTIGSPNEPPARLLVFDPVSRAVSGSKALDLVPTSNLNGDAPDRRPSTPLVAGDGTSFLFDSTAGTTVIGLTPAGDVMAGWPYSSSLSRETTDICPPDLPTCTQHLAVPAVGPEGVIYLLQIGTKTSAGGRIVAIDPNGRVHEGWPVNLRNRGAEFWSVVVGDDGTAYALAIEREPVGSSATIVAIAPNSKVEYTATILEPVPPAGGPNPSPTGP